MPAVKTSKKQNKYSNNKCPLCNSLCYLDERDYDICFCGYSERHIDQDEVDEWEWFYLDKETDYLSDQLMRTYDNYKANKKAPYYHQLIIALKRVLETRNMEVAA